MSIWQPKQFINIWIFFPFLDEWNRDIRLIPQYREIWSCFTQNDSLRLTKLRENRTKKERRKTCDRHTQLIMHSYTERAFMSTNGKWGNTIEQIIGTRYNYLYFTSWLELSSIYVLPQALHNLYSYPGTKISYQQDLYSQLEKPKLSGPHLLNKCTRECSFTRKIPYLSYSVHILV